MEEFLKTLTRKNKEYEKIPENQREVILINITDAIMRIDAYLDDDRERDFHSYQLIPMARRCRDLFIYILEQHLKRPEGKIAMFCAWIEIPYHGESLPYPGRNSNRLNKHRCYSDD